MKKSLKIIFLVLLIAEALVTLLAAYGGIFNPRYFYALPAMVSMTFPAWVVITPVMMLIAVVTNRRLALIPAATMLLCIGSFFDVCPLNFNRSHHTDKQGFSLLSYNVLYCENYLDRSSAIEDSPTIRAILDSDADVVCLQETLDIKGDRFRGITPELVDSLFTRYPHRIYNNSHLGILSKYPIDTIAAPSLPGATATMMIADVHIDDRTVRFYNLHLQSIGLTADDKELYKELTRGNADNHLKQAKSSLLSKLRQAFVNRANQAALIKEVMGQMKCEYTVVCGDFNDIPGCYAIRTIESEGLKNAYTDAGFGPVWSYRADRFYFHIDQVLYNSGLKPTYMTIAKDTGLSDHLPQFVEFEFR